MSVSVSVKKHGERWGVFRFDVLLSSLPTEAAANILRDRMNAGGPPRWRNILVEKTDFLSMQDVLEDDWEPYAVDEKFHYFKKKT